MILFIQILLAVVSVRAENGMVYSIVQDELALNYQLQSQLAILNQRFELRLRSTKDVQVHSNFLLSPKTSREEMMRSTFQSVLPRLQSLESGISELRLSLGHQIITPHLGQHRLLGIATPPIFPLYNGTSLSSPRRVESKDGSDRLSQGVREVCFVDPGRRASVSDYFFNLDASNSSCIHTVESAELLEDPFLSLSKKIELLTGAPLPKEIIENPDPDYRLDFSNAPKLRLIILGYLEYKHDLSGRLMAQAIAHHAASGTPVRILLPGLPVPGTNFVKGKDEKLLAKIEASGPDVEVVKYTFLESQPDLTTPLGILGRSQHAKVMVTIGSDPRHSSTIVGGRNIKDTFYMKKMPDYTKWPEMVQYSLGDEKFGIFRDLEVHVQSHSLAEQTAAQLLAFLNIQKSGPRVIQSTRHIPIQLSDQVWEQTKSYAESSLARHWFSVPYVDDQATEKMFVELLNRASSKIRLITPYFRPPKSIRKAMLKAMQRGVQLQVLTGFSLGHDNVAPFVEDMNKMSVNELLNSHKKLGLSANLLKIYEWREATVMHSKVLALDDRVLIVSSINLDQRGLRHDTENGLTLTGSVVLQFNEIFEKTYLPHSQQVTEPQKVRSIFIPLIKLLDGLDMT